MSFSLQVGLVKYKSFSVPKISHTNSGKQCSFEVKLNLGETPPKFRQLVSVVFTHKTGDREKLFGGEVGNVTPLIQFFPYRVYQVTCKDFESIFLNVQPFDYEQLSPQPIGIHLAEILRLGACTNPQDGREWIRDRLGSVINQPNGLPPWIENSETDDDRQPFSVQNSFLREAVAKLCKQFGFSYAVDFGEWFDISNLGNNPLARLVLTRNDYSLNREKLLIDLSPNADKCLQKKWANPKVQFQARDVTRVIVAKDPESLLNANAPQFDTVNNYLIAANSPEQSVGLLKKTGTVKSYFITTGDEGGGDGDGGDGGGF